MVAEYPAPVVADKKRTLSSRIDILTRSKARNLYFFQEASHERISKETGLTVMAVGQLISREGWAKEKRQRIARLAKAHDTRVAGLDSEIIETIATRAEQHALEGLDRVAEALQRSDRDAAKDFQAYTSGVKNLATTAKAMREPIGAVTETGGNSFNLFFVGAPMIGQAQAEAKAEPKQVTEIECNQT